MSPIAVTWIVMLISAAMTGASVVGVMVVRRRTELLTMMTGILSFGVCTWAYTALTAHYARTEVALYALAFIIGAMGGGFALVSSLLERYIGSKRSRGDLPSQYPRNESAVVILCPVDPPDYDPGATAELLERLATSGLIEMSLASAPFMFLAQKARYRAIGGPVRGLEDLAMITERVAAAMPSRTVVHATYDGDERLAAVISELAGQGHRRLTVIELAIGQSAALDSAKHEVDALRLDDREISVEYTGPLADVELVSSFLVERILQAGTDETGVVLLGHGQPEEIARTYSAYDEAENRFLHRLRLRLVEAGVEERAIRIAWMQWRNPDTTAAVRHLSALGAQRILVVPACDPVDSLALRLDLPAAVKMARIDDQSDVTIVSPWGDTPMLTEALVSLAHKER